MKDNSNLRIMVRSAYDLQALRIQQGNRIVANFKAKLGQAPSASEETLDQESKDLLAKLRKQDKLITTGAIDELEAATEAEKKAKKEAGIVSELLEKHYKTAAPEGELPKPNKFTGDAVISNFTELCLIQQYKEIQTQEANQFSRLKYELENYPVYVKYLKDVKGIGPAMAGVLLSELNIETAKYASSFTKYAGIDVAADGRGRTKQAAHLVDWEYTNRDGDVATRKGITFNPFLKTKLLGVMAPSFLRSKSPYADLYNEYKHRLENHPEHSKKTKIHRHRMALRRTARIFLQDFWVAWRTIDNLPVSAPYHVAKLGLSDHGLMDKFK